MPEKWIDIDCTVSLNVFEQHIAAAPNLGCLQSTPLLDVVTDVLMGNYGRRVLPNGLPDLVNEWTPQFNKPVPWCKRDKYIWNHFKADIYIYIYSIMPNWCGLVCKYLMAKQNISIEIHDTLVCKTSSWLCRIHVCQGSKEDWNADLLTPPLQKHVPKSSW